MKLYRHFKGGIYRYIGIAQHSETLEMMVIYRSLRNPHQIWIRPKEMFFDEARPGIKRFTLIRRRIKR